MAPTVGEALHACAEWLQRTAWRRGPRWRAAFARMIGCTTHVCVLCGRQFSALPPSLAAQIRARRAREGGAPAGHVDAGGG